MYLGNDLGGWEWLYLMIIIIPSYIYSKFLYIHSIVYTFFTVFI